SALLWRRRRCIAFMAKTDAAALQIVRRHLYDHTVANSGTDAEFAHLARRIGEHLVLVVELHPEISIRKNLGDRTIEFQQLFFRHPVVSNSLSGACRGRRCGAAYPSAA